MSPQQPDALARYEGKVALIEAKTEAVAEWLTANMPLGTAYAERLWAVEEAALLALQYDLEEAGFSLQLLQQAPTY
jgi:hypothetical protein